MLFVLSPEVEVDQWGDMLLRSLQAQGLPSVVACVASEQGSDAKSRQGVLKSLLSFMQYFVPSLNRVFDLSTPSDQVNALRALCEGKPADVRWREHRPWILADDVSWSADPDTNAGSSSTGRLQVTGIVRGAPLSVNRLMHIPSFGDYQVERIVSAPLPRSGPETGMEVEPVTLRESHESDADSLVSTNIPDDLEGEQTWPTEEEMQGLHALENRNKDGGIPDAEQGTTPRRIKRVPKGWSEYQATWIVEDGAEGDEDGEENESVHEDIKDGSVAAEVEAESDVQVDEDDEMEDLAMENADTSSRKGVTFQDLDAEEDSRQ